MENMSGYEAFKSILTLYGFYATMQFAVKQGKANCKYLDSKVHGTNMRSMWGRQGLGGPHVGPMTFELCYLGKHVHDCKSSHKHSTCKVK